jgi:uncharacterized membrane protein YgcG
MQRRAKLQRKNEERLRGGHSRVGATALARTDAGGGGPSVGASVDKLVEMLGTDARVEQAGKYPGAAFARFERSLVMELQRRKPNAAEAVALIKEYLGRRKKQLRQGARRGASEEEADRTAGITDAVLAAAAEPPGNHSEIMQLLGADEYSDDDSDMEQSRARFIGLAELFDADSDGDFEQDSDGGFGDGGGDSGGGFDGGRDSGGGTTSGRGEKAQ